VWGPNYQSETEIVHTMVRRLRCKLEIHPSTPRYVQTRRNVGYMLALVNG
jgi:DNA-binding response OmpR family regulator